MAEHEKSWLAAAIDGEGTITLHWKRKRSVPTGKILITNNSKKFLDYAKMITRTGTTRQKQRGSKSYVWLVSNRADLIAILRQILPYLIIKRRQAEILLSDAWNTRESWKEVQRLNSLGGKNVNPVGRTCLRGPEPVGGSMPV
jgi:hypothetical protein